MPKPDIDISLAGVWKDSTPRSSIDIPLDDGKSRRNRLGIDDRELEFINRHHEQIKEKRRCAREGK